MTPRQFAVLQHLDRNGWDLTVNISSRVFGSSRSTACRRSLSVLSSAGLVERRDRPFTNQTKTMTLAGWQLTDAGEAALVAENLRLLKEVADPGRRPRAAPWIIKVPK